MNETAFRERIAQIKQMMDIEIIRHRVLAEQEDYRSEIVSLLSGIEGDGITYVNMFLELEHMIKSFADVWRPEAMFKAGADMARCGVHPKPGFSLISTVRAMR